MKMALTYRDYRNDNLIGVDIETKDPCLLEKGPGVYRRDGYIVGVSLSNGEFSEYYPIQHVDTTPEERQKNMDYLKDQLGSSNRKVFANGLYDLDWLVNWGGMKVGGSFDDIQIAEPLLDEYRKSYSLDNLAKDYLGQGKLTEGTIEYAKQQGWKLSAKGGAGHLLWQMPQHIVAPYAAMDAEETVKIFKLQESKLREQNLEEVYALEMSLYPLLLQMRRVGVRIDEPRLYRTGRELADVRSDLQEELDNLAGREINVNSARDLEDLFNKYGLPVAYGEPTQRMVDKGLFRGNPSFEKKILSKVNHPIAQKVLELRHISTLLSMFIGPYPELLVDGRIHCQFNQLRSDEYGTVSGRFSSSNPNLQQVSARKEEEYIHSDSEILNGQVIRKLFIPEEDCDWLKMDWSQIEYRLIAHYASGEGSDVIRSRYNEDPTTDYHAEMGQMTGLEDRKIVKTLNFGAAYGMGVERMSLMYGWNLSEAKVIYNNYHDKVPFVKETGRKVANKAKLVGYIRTIHHRRARLQEANKAYVMFNRLIQGSAADVMKKAMSDAYQAGVFNTLHPHVTVHDEMDCSMPRTREGVEAGKELKHIMETCVKLRVPIIADCEYGPSWGELKKWEVE
jgi:DNA polymerase I-like protein with 3'-5' exonuclease and polymerase domains